MLARAVSLPSLSQTYIAINAMVLLWDLVVAGRILNNRRGSPVLLGLTALTALLLVPAVVVAALATTLLNGRAIYIIEWLWPLVLGICALQALVAVARQAVSPFVGVPVAALNLVLSGAAFAEFLTTHFQSLPAPVMALALAHANVLAFVFGREALVSPLALQLPVLATSFPTPYRSAKAVRAALAIWGAATVALFLAEYPRSVHAVATLPSLGRAMLQERPRGDFVLGVRVFPVLNGPPPRAAVQQDLAVVDSLGAGAVNVVLRPNNGVEATALDSLARTLDERRRNGLRLVVTLGYGAGDRQRFERDPDGYARSRLVAVDRVMRHLQPDILFPADDPYVTGVRSLGAVPARWWRRVIRDAASVAHAIRPGTRVGVTLSAFTEPDSDLFAWASARSTAVDVIGLSLQPSYGGGASLRARFLVAERWMRGRDKPVWVISSGAFPRLFGERNQADALWGTIAWATAQPRVEAFIADGAGDYDVLTGLRAPGGRLRPAVASLARAREMLAGQ